MMKNYIKMQLEPDKFESEINEDSTDILTPYKVILFNDE